MMKTSASPEFVYGVLINEQLKRAIDDLTFDGIDEVANLSDLYQEIEERGYSVEDCFATNCSAKWKRQGLVDLFIYKTKQSLINQIFK